MKNIKTITVLLLASCAAFAQEKDNDTIERHRFNHWSIEASLGQNKPIRPFADGYYSSKPNTYFYFNGVEHYDLGIRYMFSNIFGLKLDFGYDDIKDQGGSGSLEFNTKQYRLGLQGVANIGRVLRFETFTSRLGLLAHGGVQFSTLRVETGLNEGQHERDGGFMYGLTPQFRVTNWLVLTGDFTGIQNFRQHLNWDGSMSDKENSLSGTMFNTSLGVTVYLGSKDRKHADWYIPVPPSTKADAETRKRLDEIETLMNDTDKDGVPDYLDSENNTTTGVAVDTKGRAIDVNKNGIPDELERKPVPNRIDQQFDNGDNTVTNNYGSNSHSSGTVLKTLVETGSVNIFFDILMDRPNAGSTNNVYQILQYLQDNPNSKIRLTGFADKRGSEAQNKDLSQRRAMNLKRFYVAAGIDASRITIMGQGVDKSYPATQTGYDLSRRVSVELIK